MGISDLLNRRVRAQPEDDDEEEEVFSGASALGEEDDDDDDDDDDDVADDQDQDQANNDNSKGSEEADDMMDDADDDDGDDGSDNDNQDLQSSLNNISFGALAKAQSSFGPKKAKRSKYASIDDNDDNEGQTASTPLDDIRARIREARDQKREASSKKSKLQDDQKRTSKHAPTVQSTKHAVSRKRTIIEPPAISKSRDPRFDPTVVGKNSRMPAAAADTAYSFLDDYRAAELNALKEKLTKTKDAEQKESLKKTVRSTTDRLRETENRRREQKILAGHKRHEKELIREGKKSNPYYMKKSDVKKEMLMQKYNEMSSKDRAKALERRRKKVASKERQQMPGERRGFDGPPPSSDGGKKRKRPA